MVEHTEDKTKEEKVKTSLGFESLNTLINR